MELAKSTDEQPANKTRTANEADVDFLDQEPDLPYKFHSVDEQLQLLSFVRRVSVGITWFLGFRIVLNTTSKLPLL